MPLKERCPLRINYPANRETGIGFRDPVNRRKGMHDIPERTRLDHEN